MINSWVSSQPNEGSPTADALTKAPRHSLTLNSLSTNV